MSEYTPTATATTTRARRATSTHRPRGIEAVQKLRADLAAALDAALAVLQPTVPNEVEALEALPVGTVIRAVDEEGGVWVHWRGSWHNGREGDADSDLARLSGDWGITEWRVVYMPEGDE